MSDTRIADILDALYDLLAAETTLAAAVTADTLRISDGPVVTDWSGPSLLVVGGRPIQDDDSETTATWDWASLGRSGTYADITEWVFVPCGVSTVLGDATPAGVRLARRTAITLYAKAAAAIRGTTLGIDVVMWCICQTTAIKQQQTADGSEVFVDFTAAIRTQI